jgi:hypothetical protein
VWPVGSQSVFTFAAADVGVVQIATPGLVVPGGLPNTALETGAGASTTLCELSTGCRRSPLSADAALAPRNGTAATTAATTASRAGSRPRKCCICGPFSRWERARRNCDGRPTWSTYHG